MDPLTELIRSFDPHRPNFRPTELYNEGWLLKLVLNMASSLEFDEFPISFMPGATWFSEALLPTAFKGRSRSDELAESRTNADGAIGHFTIGSRGKADLTLNPAAGQFVVVEAKIHARLSHSTSNAPGFDQAARNVACIAEVLRAAGRKPGDAIHLGFTVVAPASSLELMIPLINRESIASKVSNRVRQYMGELDTWESEWFSPTLRQVRLNAISWEDAIQWALRHHPEREKGLLEFYQMCLEFN